MADNEFLVQLAGLFGVETSQINTAKSFVQLGGNSLLAIKLKSACKRKGIQITVESILGDPSIAGLLDTVQKFPLISNHTILSETRLNQSTKRGFEVVSQDISTDAAFTIPDSGLKPSCRRSQRTLSASMILHAPATEMQLCFLHQSQLRPGSNIIHYCETYSLDHLQKMKTAWRKVAESEPIFRTTICLTKDGGIVTEYNELKFDWTEVVLEKDASTLTKIDGEQSNHVGIGFKVLIFPNQDTRQAKCSIIWSAHHALIDGFSSLLLLEKVCRVAAGLSIQTGPSFVRLAKELYDFQVLSEAKGKAFWAEQNKKYADTHGEILLPRPVVSPLHNLPQISSIAISVPHRELSIYAQHLEVTLASLYFAAWAMALSFYVGYDTVTIGAIFSCRSLPIENITSTVGSLANTLPLYIRLERDMCMTDFVRYVFAQLLELSRFQWTVPRHGYKRNFSSALSIQFDKLALDRGHLVPLERPTTRVISDIPLAISVEGDGTVLLTYHSDTYAQNDLELVSKIFEAALSSLLHEYQSVDRCLESLLGEERRKELMKLGNCYSISTTTASITDDLVTLFERSVSLHGGLSAVEKGQCRITYAELNSLASTLSNRISALLRPGEVICVIADRSINWIVSIYAILKAGAIYCPLDEALPDKVALGNFKAAGARLLLIPSASHKAQLRMAVPSCMLVEEVLSNADISKHDETSIRQHPTPFENAYLCFTSGSSGKPKGVLCTHGGLVAFQSDLEVRLFSAPGRRIAQIMSPAFDGSIHEIFSALGYGGTLILSNSADPFAHLTLVHSAILTPSIANLLTPHEFPKLLTVYLVGEPVPQRVNDRWAAEKQVYNMFGPTEATCGATIKRLLPNRPVTIGVPNSSTRLYILDKRSCLVPRGVMGEIYLAGVQVARGYIGRPDETADKFLDDTICLRYGERMYRTGDRGYWNQEGEIVCLGRLDRQVKLRGFRLDLDDLEVQILHAIPDIIAVAIARKDEHLMALVQPRSLDVSEIHSLIAKTLPPYAVPQRIIAVNKFPKTHAGKIDYNTISKIPNSDCISSIQQLTVAQCSVASAIRQVLKLPSHTELSADSNLMELGGSSIDMLLLSQRLAADFHRPVPLSFILEAVTISQVAEFIESSQVTIKEVSRSSIGENVLSPIEREWFVKYQQGQGSSSFNVSYACTFTDDINVQKLAASWNTVLSRHKILRSRYITASDGLIRDYARRAPEVQRRKQIELKEINRPFNLTNEAPVRVMLSHDTMVFIASHIICDLTSMRILLREAAAQYQNQVLSPINRTYADTTLWNETSLPSKVYFWSSYLQDMPEKNTSFIGLNRSRNSYSGSSRLSKVPISTYHNMTEYMMKNKITYHQLSLAAVALAINYKEDKKDVILGAPYLNRSSKDELETVGLFLEPLPIRIQYPPNNNRGDNSEGPELHSLTHQVDSFISEVRRSSQAALSHSIPWHQLLHTLRITPDFPNHPLFDVMVTFHEQETSSVFPLPHTSPLYTWSDGAKFKLMVEFLAVSQDVLLMRFEYDDECFSQEEIRLLRSLVIMALTLLCEEVSYLDIKERLKKMSGNEVQCESPNNVEDFFGVSLVSL